MSAPTFEMGSPQPATAPVARRSLWARIRGSRFLFISILVHVLFGIGAAIYVVQVYSRRLVDALAANLGGTETEDGNLHAGLPKRAFLHAWKLGCAARVVIPSEASDLALRLG